MSDGARIADDELRRIAMTGDPISELHRSIVGHAVRIHIPLHDAIQLRRVSATLRVLASSLETLSHSRDPTWIVLSQARSSIDAADRVINPSYGKRNRPRR